MSGGLEDHDRRIGENARAIAELRQLVREQAERIEQLEQVVDTGMGAVDYEQMTRKDKVRQIRAYLFEEADRSHTQKAAMTYKEVRTLFNGRPSAGTAYNLMDASGTAEGFNYKEHEDRTNRLTVDAAEVNETAAFQSVNNEVAERTA